MPGFSFSPSMRNHRGAFLLRNGTKLTGFVVSSDPTKIVLRLSEDDENVVIVNRDDVVAYTGHDDKARCPVTPRLVVTRCCNPMMRCNGVKTIAPEKLEKMPCELYNEHCEMYSGDFFTMSADSQYKLLAGVVVGSFPKKVKVDGDQDGLQHGVGATQKGTGQALRGASALGDRAKVGRGPAR